MKESAAHVSALLLAAMVAAVGAGHHRLVTTNRASIDVCGWTDYQKKCEDSLANANTSDPVELVKLGFNVAKVQIQSAVANSSAVKAAYIDVQAAPALEMCRQVMTAAVDDLDRSIQSMGRFQSLPVVQLVDDLKVWLSSAITYQEACLESFDNAEGNASLAMRNLLNATRMLTSNCLAMADGVSTFLTIPAVSSSVTNFNFTALNLSALNFTGRRLLSASLPGWTSITRRGLLETDEVKEDVVVAKDGSGQFKTINEALKAVPSDRGNKTYVIKIKEGVYDEHVKVGPELPNLMFVGDGPTKTKITGNRNHNDGLVLLNTSTVDVLGAGFTAKNIGFENTAPPNKGSAVALLVQSDHAIFQNCQIDGYTNTLYALNYRQFYRDCTISGAFNVIGGDSAAVFQSCRIIIRRPDPNPDGDPKTSRCFVACHSRSDKRQVSGFVLQNCTVAAAPDYLPVRKIVKSYLGRPRTNYSRIIFMESDIGDIIDPDGWAPWTGGIGTDTCFLAEYQNRGAGARQEGRVNWPGIQHLDPAKILEFTADKFIEGSEWVQPTGVPYVGGMMNI